MKGQGASNNPMSGNHNKNFYSDNHKPQQKSADEGDKLQCQICGKKGHLALNCYQLIYILLGKFSHNSSSTAFNAVFPDQQSSRNKDWLLDSGGFSSSY